MEREWGLNWNSCQPATNMFLNEYNKIKSLTAVVTPSRVPWCSCSTDCPMYWDCLGGNPGAKLVLQNCGIMSSTSLQQKGGLQPPLKSSYQKVGCAVCSCAAFQRNQSLKEGFFFWESWGKKKKKKSTVGIETGWDQRGSVDAGACFGWAANLLIAFIAFTIFHLEAQIIFLQPGPYTWDQLWFFLLPRWCRVQFSAACRKQEPLVGSCEQYWGCHSTPVYNPVLD